MPRRRSPKTEHKTTVSVSLAPAVLARIEALVAAKKYRNRSHAFEALVEAGLEAGG